MSNEQPHINPWAEKLQQAPLPPADASWKGMERLLDQHLPVEEKEKKRRFFFFFFPMLLLIGVALLVGYLYNTSKPPAQQSGYGAGQQSATTPDLDVASPTTINGKPLPATADNITDSAFSAEGQVPANLKTDVVVEKHTALDKTPQHGDAADTNKQALRNSSAAVPATETASATQGLPVSNKGGNRTATVHKEEANANEHAVNTWAGKTDIAKQKKQKASTRKAVPVTSEAANALTSKGRKRNSITNRDASDNNSSPAAAFAVVDAAGNSLSRMQTLPSLRHFLTPTQQLVIKDSLAQWGGSALTDSVLQALKKKKSNEQKKGWTFSVGLNHFLRINNQQPAPYKGDTKTPDSEGLTGKVADYLPIPQARYYFNNKLLVQGELQFNTPQFTQPVQLEQRTYQEGNYRVWDTAYLKKLTYFSLPFSVHYSPLKNLYIGAGIQYSRLNSAVVLYETTKVQFGVQFPDSIKLSKQERVKDDTLFQKLHTAEFRLLGDVNYQAGPFSLGLRYNQALRGLVKVPVAGSALTQARNSSLQLYIRYRFLDKRKRVQPKSK